MSRAIVWIGCCALAVLLAPLAAAMQRAEGIAVRLPERTEVYREYHLIGTHAQQIEYRAPDGTPIAEQRLDYACSHSAPGFEQRDLRRATRFGARWQDGDYVLYRGSETRAIPAAPSLVASSGFDRFVRGEWERLRAGERIEIDFALPARLQTLRLRIGAYAGPRGDAHEGPWFRVEAASPWLRPFVDPILLGYDESRRLRAYRGVSNLAAADGASLAVDIRYSYADADPATAAADEPMAGAGRIRDPRHCEETNT